MADLDQWRAMWGAFGVTAADEGLRRDLIARYSEPHRKYHTLQHLQECFGKLRELRVLARKPEEIELALWFHDAVYDTKRKDNEEKSADWARSAALQAGVATPAGDRVHELVMATRHNAVPAGIDAQILVDVDLSILGAPPQRFDEYETQVRQEYSWVPGPLFRRERRKILEEFLKRPSLFQTAPFVAAYEARARENLQRSVEKLGG
jgi:predicted metal-dependent HD superfamily phosphohydrolase